MQPKFNKKSTKSTSHQLAIKMGLSLLLALIVGTFFIFLRESLISNGKDSIWTLINNILFQDISTETGKNAVGIFYIIGQLFINSLQFIIIPMVFSSIALAMCNINNTSKLGRISSKTLLGFLVLSVFALITASLFGLAAHNLGVFNISIDSAVTTTSQASSGSNPLMVIINAVPNNITSTFSSNSMVLSVVFLAVVTGICINTLGDKILVLKNLLMDINNIIQVFLNYVITKFSPIAVFVLITRTFAVYGLDHLKPALSYIVVVSITALVFLVVAYPLYVYLTTRLNPFTFMKKISKVALLGFSAAASSAALSLNEKTTVEEIGVDKDIASFVLPLGMTVNMNGTAIMQVIATVFIASSSGYDVSFQNIIVIAVLALIASVGTPSAPGSSSIILFSILTGMGYNNEATLIAYSLILAINRPVDMLITTLNVTGDAATALVVANSEGCLDRDIYNS